MFEKIKTCFFRGDLIQKKKEKIQSFVKVFSKMFFYIKKYVFKKKGRFSKRKCFHKTPLPLKKCFSFEKNSF